jgi:hypothetical protein
MPYDTASVGWKQMGCREVAESFGGQFRLKLQQGEFDTLPGS